MIIAHPIAGFAVTSITKSFFGKLNKKQENIVWIVGITSAILPDFDLAFAVLTGQSHHHHFITHTPIFYLVIGLILACALFVIEQINLKGKRKKLVVSLSNQVKKETQSQSTNYQLPTTNYKLKNQLANITPEQIAFFEKLIILFLINTIIHILMDIPVGQLRPLWPIYDETISLLNLTSKGNWLSAYLKSPAILLEAFWFIIGIIIIIWKERKAKSFKTAIYTTAVWMVIAILSTLILII